MTPEEMRREGSAPIVFEQGAVNPTVIKVVGVGGGGCNALNRMIEAGIPNVEFIAVNTDVQCLAMSKAPVRLAIGRESTKGLGSGADPERGRLAAEEDAETVKAALRGAHMVFIAAGMGKGTGTGASPVIARLAHELGALTVAVVTRPFKWEGVMNARRASVGIENLGQVVDSMIVIANDNINRVVNKQVRISDAFRVADAVLMNGVRGISHIITTTGNMNADFADVRKIMGGKRGMSLLSMARATGENKVSELLAQVTTNPLIESHRDDGLFTIDGARSCLVHLTHGPDISMWEITEILNGIHGKLDPSADIIPSVFEDATLKDEVQLIVVATGFAEEARVHPERIDEDVDVIHPEAEKITKLHAAPVEPINLGSRQVRFLQDEDLVVSEKSLLRDYAGSDETLRQNGVPESEIPAFLRKSRT